MMIDANHDELAPAVAQALEAAKEAGLRYVSDESPGIERRLRGKEFEYYGKDGKKISDAATLERIRKLAIPPAWTKVWICPTANGHIQATGRDARGRKQYRYHADWRANRDATKFDRMIAFGKALPKIRQRVARDLKMPGLPREKVLAAIVRLLEATHIRVGNETYAQQNHSFGLTTLRDRHARIKDGTIHFHFKGKSGKVHDIDLHDPQLAKIVRNSQEIPGQELFQYIDADGHHQPIRSDDVNAYLREIVGEAFSAKDFRTWAGTVLAAVALQGFATAKEKPTKKNLVMAIEEVAKHLGNTPAICRKCYIHPAVMDGYLVGETVKLLHPKLGGVSARMGWKLGMEEAAVLGFLQARIKQEKTPLTTLLAKSIKQKKSPRSAASAPR